MDHVEEARGDVVVDDGVHPVAVHRAYQPKVQEKAERGDDGEVPVDLAGDAALDGKGQAGTRLDGRRRDELEQERRLPDDDLPARLVREADLVGRTDALRLALERDEIGDARGERHPAGHPVEEVQVVVAADQLEELELSRQRGLHHEHRLFARADGDARALLDHPLLEDAPGGDEPDAKDLRPCVLLHRAHDRGHLTRASSLCRRSHPGARTLVHLRHAEEPFETFAGPSSAAGAKPRIANAPRVHEPAATCRNSRDDHASNVSPQEITSAQFSSRGHPSASAITVDAPDATHPSSRSTSLSASARRSRTRRRAPHVDRDAEGRALRYRWRARRRRARGPAAASPGGVGQSRSSRAMQPKRNPALVAMLAQTRGARDQRCTRQSSSRSSSLTRATRDGPSLGSRRRLEEVAAPSHACGSSAIVAPRRRAIARPRRRGARRPSVFRRRAMTARRHTRDAARSRGRIPTPRAPRAA